MELVVRDDTGVGDGLVNPTTGEVIDLYAASREDIAAWFLDIQAWIANAHQAIRIAEMAFADKTDRETSLSVVVGGTRVAVPAAEDTFVPDAATLRAALVELVAAGELSPAAADEACKPNAIECPSCGDAVPTGGFKVNKRALANLRKNPKLVPILDACGEYVSPDRRFKTSRG